MTFAEQSLEIKILKQTIAELETIVHAEESSHQKDLKSCMEEIAKLKSEKADLIKGIEKSINECTEKEISKLVERIKDYPNPYPRDIFSWSNMEKLKFNRGRFNEFTYKMFENFRKDILALIEKEMER